MTNKEIDAFIFKYGGVGIDFYVGKVSKSFSAYTCYLGKDKASNRQIYVIVLDRKIFRNKKNPISFLQALILHEIGHIKCKHFHRKMANSTAEFEAQTWALNRALKKGSFNVVGFLIQIVLSWGWLVGHKKRMRYYYGAYRMFCKTVGKEEINKWKQYFGHMWEYGINRLK